MLPVKKFICIHGHFYQPPRENAWLEIIERQLSAHPYHDWNERISAECYGPNAASRILNDEQKIVNIVNNYASISFNFGPTLFSWMEINDPETYAAILEADRISGIKFNGHGNAIAQVYNHMIMPLANTRDKLTQIIWGIEDFKSRFNREPEGMWLAETAVDTETLELLALNKIKFTILAPRQAKAYKKLNDSGWKLFTDENEVDTTIPYTCKLPSGNSITLFFYNGQISREVAFNGLLNSGKLFSQRLSGEFNAADDIQLVHIATDGETYGHHHYRGDMALASCINAIESEHEIQLTNYAHFNSLFSPQHEIQIHENSSWSCVHGVERWRSNCGCTDGAHPAYHQKWREPLRAALNWLRDQLIVIYEKEMLAFTPDPWTIRNKYIEIILNRSEETTEKFIHNYFLSNITSDQKSKIIRLLEMQRHAMLMFTSCGWFFEELTGLEAKQILHYADRAIQIAEHETNIKLYDDFLHLLSLAPSNIPAYGNGEVFYEKEIRPLRITLTKVGVHHAILSLFEDKTKAAPLANYSIRRDFFESMESGNEQLVVGNFFLSSDFTFATESIQFAALHFGQHHVMGGYAEEMDTDAFEEMYLRCRGAFRNGNATETILLIKEYFGEKIFSFNGLFKEEQQKILTEILNDEMQDTVTHYRDAHQKNYALLLEMRKQKFNIPEILRKNLEVAVNAELMGLFRSEKLNLQKLDQLTDEVQTWTMELNKDEISFLAANRMLDLVLELKESPSNFQLLETISRVMIRLSDLKIKLKLWKVQNVFFSTGQENISNNQFIQKIGTESYQKWLLKFKAVGEQMNIRF